MTTRRGVAAFDFDGTLVAGDSLPRFLARLLGRARLTRVLAGSAAAMTAAYWRGGRDGAKAALLARSVAGLRVEDVEAVGTAFGADLARRIRPDLAEWMAWHDGQGHQRILVSASLAIYLEPFGRLTGFDRTIATRLETGPDGRLTGRMEGKNVRGEEKALRLRQALGSGPYELWVYGDSPGDREMLAMAHHPVHIGFRRRRPPPPSVVTEGPDTSDCCGD
jgi:phosphatidylglycerophosphatase C